MKKLFTLLTLLVAIVTGAQAADESYTLTGNSSSITNGYTANIGGAYVGRVGSNYTPDATNGLPTGNSKIFAAFKLNQKAKINTVFVWTKTNGDLSGKSISLVSLTEADYNQLVTAAGGETKYSNVAFTNNQTATVECLRANANVDFDVPFTNAVEAGYYAVYTASSVNEKAYIKRIEITYDSNPSDTRTNLVGAWTNDAPTFEYGEAATVPTFDVTPNTATPGTAYSVAYTLTTDGGNVTLGTNGITAIDTETAGTSVVKATITVIDGDNYKATTSEYETTITVNPEPGTEPVTIFSADVTVTSNQSFAAGTVEVTSTQATISGGKVYAINGQSDNKDLIATQSNIGYFCMTNNDTYFKVELNQALAEGDIITAKGIGGEKKGVAKGIWVTSTEGRPNSAPACAGQSTSTSVVDPILSYTVTANDEYVGKTVLYISRAAGASTYFDEFKITRPFTPLPSSIDLTVNQSAGATTVYSDYALDFSELENAKAYIETGTDENLTWTAVTTAPAKTGLLVVTSESGLTVPVIASSTTDVTGNRLKGVATGESKTVAAGENIYIFTLHNGVTPGFFPAAVGRELTVGKAYLDMGSVTPAREFFAIDVNGATTGIDAVESASSLDASAPIYNLAGQKVSKSFKGIVIQNGKKYINK